MRLQRMSFFEDALSLVLDMGQASKLHAAATLPHRLYACGASGRYYGGAGIVGQSVGSKPREVIMSRKEAEERFLRRE
mgnify:CR=1 FL=1